MLRWTLSMMFFEVRCLVAGTAIWYLLKSYGVLDALLKEVTRHFISVRMKLPVLLDKIVLRLHWSGSGELEISNLRILAPTVHVRRVPSSELTHDDEDDDDDDEEEEEEEESGEKAAAAAEEEDEQDIVRIRSVFVSFFTLQSLVAIVSSGGTQLAADNVCIDGLRINIETIDVVEDEAGGRATGEGGGDGLTPDGAPGSLSGGGGSEGPRQLKKLLNIWLIANAVSGNAAPAPDPPRRRRPSVSAASPPPPAAPAPFNLTWRESRTPEPQAQPKPKTVSPSKEKRPPAVVVVSPSVMASYGLPTLPTLASASAPHVPTVKARVVAAPREAQRPEGGGFWGLGLEEGGQTLTGLLESAGLSAGGWECGSSNGTSGSSRSSSGGGGGGGRGGGSDSNSGGISSTSSPIKDAPSLDPLLLLRQLNESAHGLLEEVQSGRLQSRLARQVDALQVQASEFKEQVLQEGLLTATSRRVKRSLHHSRHALEEDLRKNLPSTVAELHARLVGPDDPGWTRDVLAMDRVWMGGCLLVLDIEIRFRGMLPPVMGALERPLQIQRLVMEGIGHPAVVEAGAAAGADAASSAGGAGGAGGGGGESRGGRAGGAGPRLADGWALPLLQRRLEIALIAEATRGNILGAVDEMLVLTSMQEREVAAERTEPRAEVEAWNFELT